MGFFGAGRGGVLTIVLGAAVLLACGDDGGSEGGSSDPTYSSPQEMADELGCADTFEDHGLTDDTLSGVVLESGSCTFEGEVISLDVAEEVEGIDLTPAAVAALCQVGATAGISEYVFAAGPGWISTPEVPGDEELVATVADRLGGAVRTLEC